MGFPGSLPVYCEAITEDSAWMNPDRTQSHHNSSSKCSAYALTTGGEIYSHEQLRVDVSST